MAMNDISRTGSLRIYGTVALGVLAVALLFLGLLPAITLLLLPIFAVGLYRVARWRTGWSDSLLWLITLLLGFFIAIYRPAGFSYPRLSDFGALYPGGGDFTLHLNTAKAIGGYLVLLWLFSPRNSRGKIMPLLPSLLIAAGGIIVILSAGVAVGLTIIPKFPAGIAYFVLANLLVTVVAEEAFFRLLLQNRIMLMLGGGRVGILVSISIAALIFALSHTTKLGPAFLLFFIAGMVYAGTYALTRRFSAALFVHFGTNICHLLLLEYPLPGRLF